MRILIDDGMQINVGTGIGKYSLYLYNTLKERLTPPDSVDLSQFEKGNVSKQKGRLRYLKHINSYTFYKECGKYDVVHFTNYAMPFLKNKNTRYIVTVHDLASFLHPDSLPKIYGVYSRAIIYFAIERADVILTVSNSVREEIIEKWPHASRKVKVAYPGLYSEFSEKDVRNEFSVDKLNNLTKKRFFLFTGTIETRKNLGIVIKAFIKMKANNPNNSFKLVLAGRPGYGYEELYELITQSEYSEDIITTGYLPKEDILKLYKDAAAYVFPSIYEGFGSTQLECMINHLPIILSDIPTNREVSGNYGLYFKLGDEEQLLQKMEQIVNGEIDYDSMCSLADEVCKKFSWDRLISSYIDVYNKSLLQI